MIRDVVFRERLRGYDEDHVDEFLERVATGVEILQERLRHAVERAELAERRSSERLEGDDAMRRTLTLARRTADVAVEEGKAQGARIVEEASEHGRQIVDRAQELARRQAAEAQEQLRRDLAQLEAARQQLRSDVAAFERYLDGERSRLRLALGDAIRWIEEGIPSLVPSPLVHDAPLPPRPEQWGEWEAPSLTAEVVAQYASPEPVPDAVAEVVPDVVADAAGAVESATAFWPSAQPEPEPVSDPEPVSEPAEARARPEAVEADAVEPRVFATPPPWHDEHHEHDDQRDHRQGDGYEHQGAHVEGQVHDDHREHDEHGAHVGHQLHDERGDHDEQLEAETDAPAQSEGPPSRAWRAWWRRSSARREADDHEPAEGEPAEDEAAAAPEPAASDAPGAPAASGVEGEHPGDEQHPHWAGPYDHVGSP